LNITTRWLRTSIKTEYLDDKASKAAAKLPCPYRCASRAWTSQANIFASGCCRPGSAGGILVRLNLSDNLVSAQPADNR
jgi:hypothetical protein